MAQANIMTALAFIQLGNLAVRGERGMLLVPASDMLRIHWNPFYPYLEQRVLNHIFDNDTEVQ